MAQRDISSGTGGWTHTDPSATITETPHRLRWESHDSSDTAYNYKAETISGNFAHYVTFGFDSSTGTSAMGVWCATDTVGTISALTVNASAHALMLYLEDTGSVCKLKLIERDGATLVQTGEVTLAEKYRYRALYLKIDRTSSAFTATVYRGPGQTEQIYQISQTLNSVQDYDYVMLAQSAGLHVYEEYTEAPTTAATIYTNAVYQTFTVSAGEGHVINFVSVMLAKKGTGCTSVTAAIYATSGGAPTGAALATSTAQNATAWSASAEWHTFVFPSPYTAVESTKYAIRISGNGNSTNDVTWHMDNVTYSYAGGSGFYNGTTYLNWDFPFKEGTGYGGTANGFTSALYINDTPTIFTPETVVPLMYVEDSDGFSGFPNSDETWTKSESGASTIAESSAWSSDGDGKSALITLDGTNLAYAYFTPTNSSYGGGVWRGTVKVTSLGMGESCGFGGIWFSTAASYVMGIVVDVSGTKYFRLRATGTDSTGTKVICELNTEYDVVIIRNHYTNQCAIIVDGVLADNVSSTTAWIPNRIFIGSVSTHYDGTVYVDDVQYMNGTGYFPSIERGGEDNNTMVAAFMQSDSHNQPSDAYARFQYSTDDGVTWAPFWEMTIDGSNQRPYTVQAIRWCAARNSWFFFVRMHNGAAYNAENNYTRVYECTSLTTPTVTLIRDYLATDSRHFLIWPTRELDSTGKLYVATENTDDATHSYVLKSARFNWADGALSTEQPFANDDDLYGSHTSIAEPMLWINSTGQLCATIRFTYNSGQQNDVRYKVSTDLGASDWTGNALIDPGTDHYQRNAVFRWFSFRGSLWCQGRDNQCDGGGTILTDWDTCILRADQDTLNFVDEVWFPSLGEGGNGDVDAKVTVGPLYIDVVTDMYSSAWFLRMNTGEIGIEYKGGVIFF